MEQNRRSRAAARQLSLVAYLLFSGGRPRSEAEIRENLPAYREVYETSLGRNAGDEALAADALRKRLARDVAALGNVGIAVSVEPESEGRRYSLAPEDYGPAEVTLEADERAVLVGALRSLRRDFPYLGPLKLAVANLIGAASEEESPKRAAAFAAVATRDDERVASRLDTLERGVLRRKRVRFDYYAMGSGETSLREVEPYALSLIDGVWYVVGRDTGRDALRQFRLSRIRGGVTFSTKRDFGDFEVPPDFERRLAGPRAPWQLGEPEAAARFEVPEAVLRAERKYRFALEEVGDGREDFRVVATDYSGERQLAGWLLSLGEGVRALSPEPLVGRVREGLEKLVEAHSADAPELQAEPPSEARS